MRLLDLPFFGRPLELTWHKRRWLYLAVVLDVGSRRVIGHLMAAHMTADLVIDTVDTASATRGGRATGVIFRYNRTN